MCSLCTVSVQSCHTPYVDCITVIILMKAHPIAGMYIDLRERAADIGLRAQSGQEWPGIANVKQGIEKDSKK